MKAGRLAGLLAGAVLAVTALYFFVYLWRWEWNRALIAGILFVATEVAVATGLVLSRLQRLERPGPPDPAVLARIRASAPPKRDHFEWLSPKSGEAHVFVPVLIGMGVVASGLAWLVEHLARATARPVLERGLASRMRALAWPEGGLVPDPADDPLAVLHGPVGPGLRG